MAAKKPRTLEEAIKQRRDRLAAQADNRSLFVRVALLAAVCWGFLHFLFMITQVKGMDMFPAVKDGDLAIVFRMQQEYAKNDVIAYRTDTGTKFGRIVARATDVVTIDDTGSLTVNGTTQTGEILYPTYPDEDGSLTYPYTVPENCVFVLGDYRHPRHRQPPAGGCIAGSGGGQGHHHSPAQRAFDPAPTHNGITPAPLVGNDIETQKTEKQGEKQNHEKVCSDPLDPHARAGRERGVCRGNQSD